MNTSIYTALRRFNATLIDSFHALFVTIHLEHIIRLPRLRREFIDPFAFQ